MQKGRYFVTSTGTSTGKTIICCAIAKLINRVAASGFDEDFSCIKPIISGYSVDEDNDLRLILQSLGKDYDASGVNSISLYRYKLPLAPNMAASIAGDEYVNISKLHNFIGRNIESYGKLIIEGAGGLYVPINDEYLTTHLIQDLALPVILICPSFLGSISYSLSAIENLLRRKIKIAAIIVNENMSPDKELYVQGKYTMKNIKNFIKMLDIDEEKSIKDIKYFNIDYIKGTSLKEGLGFMSVIDKVSKKLQEDDFYKYLF